MNTTENKAAATPVVTGTANTIKTETLCSLNENSASEISETSGSSIRDKALSDSVGQEPGTSGASRRVELISDPAMMADFLRTLVQDGGIFEVRALRVRVRYGKPATYSGYYDQGMIDQAVSDIVKLNRKTSLKGSGQCAKAAVEDAGSSARTETRGENFRLPFKSDVSLAATVPRKRNRSRVRQVRQSNNRSMGTPLVGPQENNKSERDQHEN
jgi:hypothetical protein